MNLTEVKQQAQRELDSERFRAAVDAEKLRIRAHQPFWSRFFAWLPFSITIKRK